MCSHTTHTHTHTHTHTILVCSSEAWYRAVVWEVAICLVALCLHDISGDLREDRLILKAPVEEALDIGTL